MSKEKDQRNGYYQADKLRKARRKYHLPAAEQALFYELVAICNEDEWPEQFICSNGELCSSLLIQEKALIRYRLSLIDAGLIHYKSGKSRKEIGSYSFFKKFDYCLKDSPIDSQVGNQSGNQHGNQDGQKKPDYIDKPKTKVKVKLNNTVVGGKPPTKKTSTTAVEFWQPMVDTWFTFYKEKFLIDPTFSAAMAKSFKTIVSNIKKLGTADGTIWTEDYAVRLLQHFFKKAYGDAWLRENFLLTNLNSKFDSIVQKNQSNEKKPTGSAVSSTSILSKINSMPD